MQCMATYHASQRGGSFALPFDDAIGVYHGAVSLLYSVER